MKKILVIGAGIGQIHLVQLAKEMGLYVIVVSPKGYPAIEFADELLECDIYDYDRIVEYGRINHIDAVTSDQNDLMVPTVAYVAERLGLPGLTYEQALSYCDKNRFRAICHAIDVPVPKSVLVKDCSLPKSFQMPLPWIVKPTDSQSSIGVSKIEYIEEYVSAVDDALCKSKHHKAILESFFEGDEFVCEGFVYQGKYYNIFLGDRRYFKGTLIPCQTLFPSQLDDRIQKNIIDCERKITAYIKPSFGIIHSEYIVNQITGDFIIVESAIRGGGVYISSHLIPLATGIDVNRLLLRCALGENVDMQAYFKNREKKASAYVCFTLPEGTVSKIEGIDIVRQMTGVALCDIRDLKVGQCTQRMAAKGQRKGPILIYGKDRKELESIIKQIQVNIQISIKNKDGVILNEIWE